MYGIATNSGSLLLRAPGNAVAQCPTRRVVAARRRTVSRVVAKVATPVETREPIVQTRVEAPAAPLTPNGVTSTNGAKPADNPTPLRQKPNWVLPSEVVAFVLGGGTGADLYPLTSTRAEPAVPLLGSYRLVDVTVSNCLNSKVEKVYVLTQFNSRPLNRHLSHAYRNVGSVGLGTETGFVEPLNATLTARKDKDGDWFQGTADAVRHYLWLLNDPRNSDVQEVMVLCADQIYRMDYSQIIAQHRATGADVTLAVTPCAKESASQFGVLELDDQLRVQGFYEKPPGDVLDSLRTTASLADIDGDGRDPYAANMGVYVFKKSVLEDLLSRQFPDAVDFSRHVLAPAAHMLDIRAYPFKGYWQDVGTLRSYYNISMSLIRDHSDAAALQLWDSVTPIYTAPKMLPPAKLRDAEIEDSLIGRGCCIQSSIIRRSILGDCTRVGDGCVIEDTITFGADWYEFPGEPVLLPDAETPLGIGSGTRIRKAILDKNVRIGHNVQLLNKAGVHEASREAEGFCIRDGIICVLKNASLPDGFTV